MAPAARRYFARSKLLPAWVAAALLAAAVLQAAVLTREAGAQARAPLSQGFAELDPEEPWEIEADRLSYDPLRDEYIAEGEVVIRHRDRKLSADTVRYNLQTRTATAQGNVVLTAGMDQVMGDFAEWNLENQTGTILNGTIFIAESNYRIQGDRIEKTGPDTYRIDRGTLTTCDGCPPDWKFSGRDIIVHEDGSGTAWHAIGYIRDVPLGYYPYISYPARGKRTSGLLIPQGGYSSRRGAFATQPFYWVLNDQSDATFYLMGMSKRGWRPGAEYRYYLTREARGAVMFDYLRDEQTDTGGNSSQKWGFDDSGGEFLRPNRNRYWFRLSHENPLPAGFRTRLELDTVSDQDYLREFKSGYMGFDETAGYFNSAFGRLLDDFNDPLRANRFLVSRSWQRFSLNSEAVWYDDVRKGQNWKETLHQLPIVRFDAPKQALGTGPFFGSLRTEYVNFWQHRGSRVQRADVYPRFYYPLAFPPYLSIEPSLGLRETVWDQYQNDSADPWSQGKYFHRELFDGRLSLFTDFFRIYNVQAGDFQRIRHSVRPQLSYTYVPEVDQEDLPRLDSRDRIENRSRVGYAVTNTLTARSSAAPAPRDGSPRRRVSPPQVESASGYDYREILRLRLGQYYDFARHEEPFSAAAGKLEFFPGRLIRLDSEAAYNIYDDRMDRYNLGLTLWGRKNDRLHVEYRYDRDPLNREDEDDIEQDVNEIITDPSRRIDFLFTELRLGLSDRFTLISSYENDYTDNSTSYGIGFAFASQCWELETIGHYSADDVGVELRLRLKGIGEIGF
jgi:LPS-assembly protein